MPLFRFYHKLLCTSHDLRLPGYLSFTILLLFAVRRRLQEEEQQLRTSSLPAIPNPFPELCSPASSPVLSPGSLPPGEPSTGKYVSNPNKKAATRSCNIITCTTHIFHPPVPMVAQGAHALRLAPYKVP